MAYDNWNASAFGNELSKKDNEEDDGDNKPAAKPTWDKKPTSLSKRDREQEAETFQHSLAPVAEINKDGEEPKSSAAAKRDEESHDETLLDTKIPAAADGGPEEDRDSERPSQEAQHQDESSSDESSVALSIDNVARLPPSDDEASISSTSTVSLPPLRAAPILRTTLLRPVNTGNFLPGGISVERMCQLVMMDTMQFEIRAMMQLRQMEPTSSNAEVAAQEYIENHMNYDNELDDTVNQVNDSLNMEHFTLGTLEARHGEVIDLTTAMDSLNIVGYPVMSDEEIEIDKATSTNAEKAAALSDLYGKFYSTENANKNKKPRRDLDQRSIDFLVLQMRIEVDLIPLENKRALVEALSKCRPEEFSNARLLSFLRSDGMNTKLAAIRFVHYWEARRELFGPDKYYLRMTLSEALRDDIVALKAGVCTILPFPDMSGRPLLFFEGARNTREGYTPQSLVRAVWYIIEILVRESKDPDCSFVKINMEKYNSLRHFQSFFIRHVPYYFRFCWPVPNIPTHQCCANLFMRKVGRPLTYSAMSKADRARTIIHDVPDSELIESLSQYGIMAHMLPINMGGLVDLDAWMPRFIEQRRAIEMEEIS